MAFIDDKVFKMEKDASDQLLLDGNVTFQIEADFARTQLKNYGFIVVGPPKVGKSTLLSSLTGLPFKTSPGIGACTMSVKQTSLDVQFEDPKTHEKFNKQVYFYDTPGIEDWKDFDSTLDSYFQDKYIICTFIVLAPGTFADETKLLNLIKKLTERKVYVILALTNMYSGNNEQFTALLKFFQDVALKSLWNRKSEEFTGRHYLAQYDHGLIISVNSKKFEGYHGSEDVHNMREMIEIMFHSIDKEAITGLFLSILNNRTFFQTFGHKVSGYLDEILYPQLKGIFEQFFYNSARLANNIINNL